MTRSRGARQAWKRCVSSLHGPTQTLWRRCLNRPYAEAIKSASKRTIEEDGTHVHNVEEVTRAAVIAVPEATGDCTVTDGHCTITTVFAFE